MKTLVHNLILVSVLASTLFQQVTTYISCLIQTVSLSVVDNIMSEKARCGGNLGAAETEHLEKRLIGPTRLWSLTISSVHLFVFVWILYYDHVVK